MFPNRLVAVVNKQIEPGIAMNALAHMSMGFGASLPGEVHLMDYESQEGFIYPNISKMPFIILSEKNSSKMASLLAKAKEAGVRYTVFTNTMTEGTWEDQAERTRRAKAEDIVIYGLVLYGPQEIIREMTKKLSLWR